MPCYSPLHMYFDKDTPDGKEKHIIVNDNSVLPYIDARDGHIYSEARDVPCGKCVGCQLDRSREWALRCMLEASKYKKNAFVTLTYDNEHLPMNGQLQDDLYGEQVTDESPTLVKKHPQDFIKRLRSRLKYDYDHDGLRVFYCGEYGSDRGRPHYHLLLFNLPDQLIFRPSGFKSHSGLNLYSIPVIEDCWNYGFVVIGDVTWESCAYTARYILKKAFGSSSVEYFNKIIVPEFICMSRRPGIAKLDFDLNHDKYYEFDAITITGADGKPMVCKPPRYFDKLFDFLDSDRLAEIKDSRRESAQNRMARALDRTSLSEKEYLKLQESNKLSSIKRLKRGYESDGSITIL